MGRGIEGKSASGSDNNKQSTNDKLFRKNKSKTILTIHTAISSQHCEYFT